MAVSRYRRVRKLKGGQLVGTSRISSIHKRAADSGRLSCLTYVAVENERLDHLAGKYLGNGQLWWVIAACSGVGWWFQVPPGTRLKIPSDLNQVMSYVG